jgi:hypothetical protein
MNETELYQKLISLEDEITVRKERELRPVTDYAALVRRETWQQAWDTEAREVKPAHSVSGAIWSDAIERCLKENGAVFIPKLDEPVYIDRPIELGSGNQLVVHPETEIRLKVGDVGTCMVRTSHIVSGVDHSVQMCEGADENILIEGGIWSDQNNEGRGRGGEYDQSGGMEGSMGTFLLHNVSNIVVRDLIFRDCSPFAIQIGNATDFLIENILFDEVADGVHVEGPAARGIIRHLRGKTNDDFIALNAWDWRSSSITFGPITDILAEDFEMPPGYTWSEIRLLPGTKAFSSGERVDCDINRCIFRDIRGVHTFKMYDQPNIAFPEGDFADPIGKMTDLFFAGIEVDSFKRSEYYDTSSDGVFDIGVDVDFISIRDVRFNFRPGDDDVIPYLVSVGPKLLIWHRDPNPDDSMSCWRPPAEGDTADIEWVEVYNSRINPVVRELMVKDIFIRHPENPGAYLPCEDIAALLNERVVKHQDESGELVSKGRILVLTSH